MSGPGASRDFGLSISAAVCVALLYAHGALGGCAQTAGGGFDDGSSDDEEEEDRGDTSGDTGDLSTGAGDPGDSGSGPSGSGPTSTSGGNPTSSSTGGPQTGLDCCVAEATPGCADPSVEQCVCAVDDYCCTTEWNDECVFLVDELGCGSCGGSAASGSTSGSSSSGGNQGDCCSPGSGPGCGDPAIEQCVCQQDDYCCSTGWDETCVQEVDQFGCGNCGGSTSAAASSSGGSMGGDCCAETGMPGCGDPNIEQCVCSQDDYCCTTGWDAQCVSEVTAFGCGSC